MLFFILCCFQQFFTMPVDIENARLKIAPAIPTGAPIIVANDAIEMLSLVTHKEINDLSK